MNKIALATAATFLTVLFGCGRVMADDPRNQMPVSAPIDTDAAGRTGPAIFQSVVRIVCPDQNSSGTGFIHKSGKIITAAHVVAGCKQAMIIGATGTQVVGSVDASDHDLDLSILSTLSPASPGYLDISDLPTLQIGAQVTTWGFPGGYSGFTPLLCVGYLSGAQDFRSETNAPIVRRWVINAAFNSGNSGGPVIHLETGKVIGVVTSKLAPISPQTQSILNVLTSQQSGMMYHTVKGDGSIGTASEAQLVVRVLNELRSQVQLVIGYAVTTDDIRSFLIKNGVTP